MISFSVFCERSPPSAIPQRLSVVVDHLGKAVPQGMLKIALPKSLYSASYLFDCNWLFYKYNTLGPCSHFGFIRLQSSCPTTGHMVWHDRIPVCCSGLTNIKIIFFTSSMSACKLWIPLCINWFYDEPCWCSLWDTGALWWWIGGAAHINFDTGEPEGEFILLASLSYIEILTRK